MKSIAIIHWVLIFSIQVCHTSAKQNKRPLSSHFTSSDVNYTVRRKNHQNPFQKYDCYSARKIASSNCFSIRGGSDTSRPAWTFGSKPMHPQQQQSQRQYQQTIYPIVEDVSNEESKKESQIAKEMVDSFLSRDNRQSFITRVYAILTVQLLITAGVVLYMASHRNIALWMAFEGRMIVPFLSLTISLVSMIVMTFNVAARQTAPLKWQLLSLFTIGESIIVGFLSSFYPMKTILSAMLTTAVASGSVTMYSLLQNNPKYDLSQTGRALTSASVIFVLYGFLYICFPGLVPYSEMLYAIFGATVFSFYLSYHTRMIVTGKHKQYIMGYKDYVYGAMTLYSDIINMFLYILRIMGSSQSGSSSRN